MASGSFTGTTSNTWIKPTISWSSVANASNNTSQLTVTLTLSRTNTGFSTEGTGTFTLTIDGKTYTDTGVHLIVTYNSNTVAISRTVTIAHNADGTRSVAISCSGSLPPSSLTSVSCSGTAVLDAIPRPATISIGGSVIGSAVTVYISRAVSSHTCTLTWAFGGRSGTIAAKTAEGSVSWVPPLSLAETIPTATKGTLTVTCTTYSGSTQVGDSFKAEATIHLPDSVRPTIGAGSLLPTPYSSDATIQNWYVYIKGKTQFEMRFDTSKLSPGLGATLTSYRVELGGNVSTQSPYRVPITTAGAQQAKVRITDSRGRYQETSVSFTAYDYGAPSLVSPSVYRSDASGTASSSGTYLYVYAQTNVFSCGGHNAAALRVRYKTASGAYGDYTALTPGTAMIVGGGSLSGALSYTAELSVVDTVGGASTQVFSIPTDSVTLHLRNGGNGAAFGKYAEADGVLDCAWNTRVRGKLDVDKQLCGHRLARTQNNVNIYEAGWYTLAKIYRNNDCYSNFFLMLYGRWVYRANTQAIFAVSLRHTAASIAQLSGVSGFVTQLRLDRESGDVWNVDAYVNVSGTSAAQPAGTLGVSVFGQCEPVVYDAPVKRTAAVSEHAYTVNIVDM